MSSEVTVLNEIVEEQRKHIAQLVSQVEDLRLQFDLVLNERNEAMDERASARSVHEALVRNIISMSEFAGKAMRERDGAMAEAEELRRKLHERRQELKPAWVTSEHHEAFQALHDENQRLRDQLAAADVERRHAVAAVGEDADRFRAERDEARLQMGRILNEIDCRIEHGAESNGHLEAIYNLFKENSNV